MKLPRSVRAFLRLLNFVLLGAVVAMLGRIVYGLYKIQTAQLSTADVPLDVLAIQVLQVHHYAAYGAIVVLIWWAGERIFWIIFRGMNVFFTALFSNPREPGESIYVDEKLKLAQRATADAYLENARKTTEPESNTAGESFFENRISAKDGTLNYTVVASRQLTADEMRRVIWAALNDGSIVEPVPGETARLELSTELESKYLG